ncbi:MAG: hypothetical protein ACON5F_09435 [Jejuia sp.]
MKKIFFTVILLLQAILVLSQENHVLSVVPDTARWEIVQSQQGVRYTFKIDKYIGRVYQLVTAEKGETWQPIEFDDLVLETFIKVLENQRDSDEETLPEGMTEPIWQLFLSGHGVRYTFLINVKSGKTWKLFKDVETNESFWKLID